MSRSHRPTVANLAADLAAGRTTSALVEAAVARIAHPAGEGKRVFLKLSAEAARAAAEAQDQLRAAGYVASPLAGLPVSIKDLFDVAGEVTLAGSKALDDTPPAKADAPIVARLKAAGADSSMRVRIIRKSSAARGRARSRRSSSMRARITGKSSAARGRVTFPPFIS